MGRGKVDNNIRDRHVTRSRSRCVHHLCKLHVAFTFHVSRLKIYKLRWSNHHLRGEKHAQEVGCTQRILPSRLYTTTRTGIRRRRRARGDDPDPEDTAYESTRQCLQGHHVNIFRYEKRTAVILAALASPLPRSPAQNESTR